MLTQIAIKYFGNIQYFRRFHETNQDDIFISLCDMNEYILSDKPPEQKLRNICLTYYLVRGNKLTQ